MTIKSSDEQKYFGLKPRDSSLIVPLPADVDLPHDIAETLSDLPALNNLRMFARVPRTFNIVMSFIDQMFNHGTFDKRLRELMYLRISYLHGLCYEFRHNRLFSLNLGMTEEEIAAIAVDGDVAGLDPDANLECKAAEEITRDIRVSDDTQDKLLRRFDLDTVSELIVLVTWCNMLIRYIECMRVPYEENL